MNVIPFTAFYDISFGQQDDPHDEMNNIEVEIIKMLQDLIEDPSQINNYIPTLPEVLSNLLDELERVETDFGRVGALLSKDPVLAAKVLSLANSAYYKRTKSPIQDLKKAISVLGLDPISCIVVSLLLKDSIKVSPLHFKLFGSLIWQHSLETAIICKSLGKKFNVANEFNCYLLGLVHDLGKVILFEHISQNFSAPLFFSDFGGIQFKQNGTVCSLMLSVEVAKSWGLSSEIIQALNQQIEGHKNELSKTLYMANQISEANLMIEANTLSMVTAIDALKSDNLNEESIRNCFIELMSLPPL